MLLIGTNGKSLEISSKDVEDSVFLQGLSDPTVESFDIPLEIENGPREMLKLYAFLDCPNILPTKLVDYLRYPQMASPIGNADLDPIIEAYTAGQPLKNPLYEKVLNIVFKDFVIHFPHLLKFPFFIDRYVQAYPEFRAGTLRMALNCGFFDAVRYRPEVNREFVWSMLAIIFNRKLMNFSFTLPPMKCSFNTLIRCQNVDVLFLAICENQPELLTSSLLFSLVRAGKIELLKKLNYGKYEKELCNFFLHDEIIQFHRCLELTLRDETVFTLLLGIISLDDYPKYELVIREKGSQLSEEKMKLLAHAINASQPDNILQRLSSAK